MFTISLVISVVIDIDCALKTETTHETAGIEYCAESLRKADD